MLLFIAIAVQMGQSEGYWSTLEQFGKLFYGNIMKDGGQLWTVFWIPLLCLMIFLEEK
jgi:hypothetical protein